MRTRDLINRIRQENKLIFVILIVLFNVIFIILNLFYTGYSWEFLGSANSIFMLVSSVFLATFILGASSSSIQYISRNPLASPMTIGIFPAGSFGYLLVNILGMGSNPYYEFFLSLLFTIVLLGVYFVIDIKIADDKKIVFSFILAMVLASVSIILFNVFKMQREGALLFSINQLNMNSEKLLIGIVPLVVALFIFLIFHKQIYIYYRSPELAQTNGIRINRIKIIVLLAAALGTNSSLIMFGVISFIGLTVPNIIRIMGFENFWKNLLLSASLASLLGVSSYFISRYFLVDLFTILVIVNVPLIIPIIFRIRKIGRNEVA